MKIQCLFWANIWPCTFMQTHTHSFTQMHGCHLIVLCSSFVCSRLWSMLLSLWQFYSFLGDNLHFTFHHYRQSPACLFMCTILCVCVCVFRRKSILYCNINCGENALVILHKCTDKFTDMNNFTTFWDNSRSPLSTWLIRILWNICGFKTSKISMQMKIKVIKFYIFYKTWQNYIKHLYGNPAYWF